MAEPPDPELMAHRLMGEREVLGFDGGAAEPYEFWRAFLRRWVARGLKGVRLVLSDAHEGLQRAIAEVLAGAAWQRSWPPWISRRSPGGGSPRRTCGSG